MTPPIAASAPASAPASRRVASDEAPYVDDPETFAYEAAGSYSRGDLPGAVAVLRKAVGAHPRDGQLRFMLANALYRMGDFAEAATTYEQADELRPGHPDTLLNLGHTYFLLGKYPEAVERWEHMTFITPSDALPHLAMAVALERMKQHPAAMSHLAQASGLDAEWPHRVSIDIRWTSDMQKDLQRLNREFTSTLPP